MGRRLHIVLVCGSALGTTMGISLARAHTFRASRSSSAVQTVNASVGHPAVSTEGPHLGSRGGTVFADRHGVLVAERNAGALIRTDRNGSPTATLPLQEGVGELVSDGSGLVYVADRRADRVVVVDANAPDSLEEVGALPVAEPYGLALSPDGATLYVTSAADHQLVAFDTASKKVRWRAALRAEPRGVAVCADGTEATVGFLSSAALAVIDLTKAGKQIRWRSLNPRDHVEIENVEDDWGDGMVAVAEVREARSRFQVPSNEGRREVRGVFSVAYLGHGLVAAPHQLSTPQMKRIPSSEMQDSYGGGPEAVPAIVHQLAIVDAPGSLQPRTSFAKLAMHQPRALAFDGARDTLYLAGYGDDRIVALADASQPASYVAWAASPADNMGKAACGPDGLAVDGADIWVHCELSRRLIRLTPAQFDLQDKDWRKEEAGVVQGPVLAPSRRSDLVERGAELFRRGGDWRISDMGVMACASCHPEGRQDGLSWRLGPSILQTPMLAGRVVGTAPYKWNGGDPTLTASFAHTLERLGGHPDSLAGGDLEALAAYVQSLPTPRSPTVHDAKAVARGSKLFNGDLDCITCHNGDKFTDGGQYPLDSRGLDTTDTPSLVGLAHTAPYYHDGSAGDLYALITDKGSVHDMADFSALDSAQVTDLVAYLRSL